MPSMFHPGVLSERMFGTLHKRLSQELRLAGITDMAGANRFLKEVFLPQHNARFATPAEDQGTAFVPFTGALNAILAQRNSLKRQHGFAQSPGTSDPRCRHRGPLRQGRSASTNTPTASAVFVPRCLARSATPTDLSTAISRPRDASVPTWRPVGQVDRSASSTSPQEQPGGEPYGT